MHMLRKNYLSNTQADSRGLGSRTWLLTLKHPCRTDNWELGKHQLEQVLGSRKIQKRYHSSDTEAFCVCNICSLCFILHCLSRLGSTMHPLVPL